MIEQLTDKKSFFKCALFELLVKVFGIRFAREALATPSLKLELYHYQAS
jgi:hypothetical protein